MSPFTKFKLRFKSYGGKADLPPAQQQTDNTPAPSPPAPAVAELAGADPWTRAYEIFRMDEPVLIQDYSKHLFGDNPPPGVGPDEAGLSSRQVVEAVLKRLLEDREKAQWTISFGSHDINIRTQVERLAKFLQWSDPLVKDALSAQPYAALAWSGVSVLLPLLTSSTKQTAEMLDGFNSIGELQMYWKAFEETSLRSQHRQQYERVVEPLAKLYSCVLAYQARVICHLSKAQWARAWQNLTADAWKLDEINKLDKQCTRLIDPLLADEIRQNRDSQLEAMQKSLVIQESILETMKFDRQEDKETKLLQHLAATAGDYNRYKNLNPDRVAGTCVWFLEDERFRKWCDGRSSNLLWVSAGPGRGKSVLSKSLIDEERLTNNVDAITITSSSITESGRKSSVCYFFFKDGGEGEMDGAQALCAVLHQLFTSRLTSKLIQCALKAHKEHGATLTRKFAELWQILLDCAAMFSQDGEIICVFDALDECKESSRQEVIRMLKESNSQSGKQSGTSSARLKFLVTSRPYDDVERSFQKLGASSPYLHLEGDEKSEQIRQEIDLVIDVRVQDVAADFTADDRQKISERLKNMEHRTYLWLHLTFDIIEKSPAEYGRLPDIEKLLSHLPSEVSDAYEKILSRSKDASRTLLLLQLLLAATRPLTLGEANSALTMAIQKTKPKSHKAVVTQMWPESSFRRIVTNLCGLFVSVYDSKLSFIHQTAREFLTDSERQGAWKGRLTIPGSHSTMSRVCIWSLQLPDIVPEGRAAGDDDSSTTRHVEGLWSTQDVTSPQHVYAAYSWPVHYVLQDDSDADASVTEARCLCKMAERQTKLFIPTHIRRRDNNWEDWPDLVLASYYGLDKVVSYMVQQEKVDVNQRGGQIRTALIAAAMTTYKAMGKHRYAAIAKLLLQHGADIEAKDIGNRTALLCAVEHGAVSIVKMLLESGADTEESDTARTALLVAARIGESAIAELLLDKGVYIEAKDYTWMQTPLAWAAEGGHEAIVKLLLSHGADVEAKSRSGSTPLALAAEAGYETVAQLLLDGGANIEARNASGETPLALAALEGHEAVVKLLLANGASVDPANRHGRTPLAFAAMAGYEAVVKLLLEGGAITEIEDEDGQTPLSQAAEQGEEAVVRLLLKHGANMDAPDKKGRKPMYIASYRGHDAVAELLRQHGADPAALEYEEEPVIEYLYEDASGQLRTGQQVSETERQLS